MEAYEDDPEPRGHEGFAVCGSETDKLEWLTDQMVAVSRAVNGRRSR